MNSDAVNFAASDEADLVRLYFDRNEDAIRQTEARHGAYCHRIAYGILRDLQDAKECENDGYYRVWESIPPAVPACFRTFLGKIVRNLALDRRRARSAKKRPDSEALLLQELVEILPANSDPADDLLFAELTRKIGEFLRRLPREPRVFFIQRYWYGMNSSEIARSCGCTEQKVRTALSRTRKNLKKELEEEGYEK